MLLPIGIAISSIACGALLALVPAVRSRLLDPIRTFALTASLAVVVTHLLPESFEAIHGWALVLFLGALALPSSLHAWAERVERSSLASGLRGFDFGIEFAYAGLVLHQFADGIGLGTYGGGGGGAAWHPDVLIAIFAHTVPMVTILVIGVYDAYGFSKALVRAALLVLATSAGIVAVEVMPAEVMERVTPWISAAAAGLLLHVVTHAQPRVRQNSSERAFDLLFALLGLGVALAGESEHLHFEADIVRREFGAALLDLTLDVAPLVFAGLLLGAGGRWLVARTPLRPFSDTPFGRIALTVFSPELGLSALFVAVRFVGLRFAVVRLLTLLLLGVMAGYLSRRVAPRKPLLLERPDSPSAEQANGAVGLLRAVEAKLTATGAWVALGLVIAAFTETQSLAHDLAKVARPSAQLLGVLVLTGLAVRAAPVAVALGAVLIAKGISPGAVIMGLSCGAALAAFFAPSLGEQPLRLRYSWLLPLLVVALAAGALFDRLSPNTTVHAHDIIAKHDYGAVTYVAACALGVLALLGIWRLGASAWLGTLWSRQVQASHSPRT